MRATPSPVRALSSTPSSAHATRMGHARLDRVFGRPQAAASPHATPREPGAQNPHTDAEEALARAAAAEAAAKRKDEQIDRMIAELEEATATAVAQQQAMHSQHGQEMQTLVAPLQQEKDRVRTLETDLLAKEERVRKLEQDVKNGDAERASAKLREEEMLAEKAGWAASVADMEETWQACVSEMEAQHADERKRAKARESEVRVCMCVRVRACACACACACA